MGNSARIQFLPAELAIIRTLFESIAEADHKASEHHSLNQDPLIDHFSQLGLRDTNSNSSR